MNDVMATMLFIVLLVGLAGLVFSLLFRDELSPRVFLVSAFSSLFLLTTCWLTGPWLGYGVYQIHRWNMNLIHNRSADTIVVPPEPVKLQAPLPAEKTP